MQMMALAAGPVTPLRERGEGDGQDGPSGDDQQERGETWEVTEPLGGTAAGTALCCISVFPYMLLLFLYMHVRTVLSAKCFDRAAAATWSDVSCAESCDLYVWSAMGSVLVYAQHG